MSSLYRRHRPQTWEAICGQNPVKRTLGQEIKDARLVHAYLFAGPRGVGKTSIARIFAKAVNCAKRPIGQNEPCNECANCEEITAGRSLDVLEIDAASHTGVDNVRESIIENARFLPGKCKYKVFVIDEAHMLSISAFNALLKILEEPPAYVIFILATTELDKVPETIISRCQCFDFKKIPHQEIVARLKQVAQEEKIAVADDVYERIARQSEGCARDAEGLLGQLFSLGELAITSEMADLILPRFHIEKLIAFVESLIAQDVGANLNLVQTLAAAGADLALFHDQLIEFLRFIMIAKFNLGLARESFHLNDAALKSAEELAGQLTAENLLILLEETINAKKWWKNARIAEMPLELLTLKIAREMNTGRVTRLLSKANVAAAPSLTPAPAIRQTMSLSADALPASSKSVVTPGANFVVSLDEIKKKWNDLLKCVQTYHHSLPVILRMSEPLELVGNVLRIGLKYGFHVDKIKERKMSSLVEQAFADVLGARIFIEPVIMVSAVAAPLPNGAPSGIEFDELVQAFGGVIAPSV